MHRILPIGLQRAGAAWQILSAVQFQRGNGSGGGQRMAGIGITMEEFDARASASHDGIIDVIPDRNRPHGHGGIRQPLRHGHDIGRHAQAFRAEIGAKAAKAGDDLIINQQNAMLGADIAQALQVAHRRHQHAG